MKSEERIVKNTKKKKPLTRLFFLEAPPGIGPGIRVLQTRALPLGHGAVFNELTNADANDIRTRNVLERITGLEPATFALARRRSTK